VIIQNLTYSAYERLGTSGSNLKNLFHEKCQNAGVNGEWVVPKCRSNNNNRFIHPTRQTVRLSNWWLIAHNRFIHPKRLPVV